ncbi:MAG TPA: hypothetical protein VK137_20075, partial [Planctomycetaceae bacterium]|nr:hypothetical protein [Planctomycetaceae bacterium]
LPDNSPVAFGLIDLVDEEPIIIRSHGRVFAVQEIDDGDIEAYLLSQNPKFFAILDKARAEAEEKGWLTTEELKARLGLE